MAPQPSEFLRGVAATSQDFPLDREAVRLRIETLLRERGRLTNGEVRRISGFSRTEVLRIMQGLVKDGKVVLRGRGRAAHYEPGPVPRGQRAAKRTRRK